MGLVEGPREAAGARPVTRGGFPPPPAQALFLSPGAGVMPAPESRSVFEAAQDPVLLHGLTLVVGAAADASEPAAGSRGAWGWGVAECVSPGPRRGSSVPGAARAAGPRLGCGCCLEGESMDFARCHPEVPKALCAAVGLFGWLRRDAGGPAAWGAACAQPLLPLPGKPASASSEKTPGVPEVPERPCCSTCGQVFGSREEQVSGAGWPAGGGSVAARVLLWRLSPSAPAPQSSAAQVLLESVTQTLHIMA